MRIRPSARFIRTFLALIVSGVLMYNLLLLKADSEKNERELAFNLTAVSWKVSETIFEAKRLEVALNDYNSGLASRDDVILYSELLWSRLGVLQEEALPLHPEIIAALVNMNDTLAKWESDIYEAPELPTVSASELAQDLAAQAGRIRSLWIGDFLSDRDAMLAAGQIGDNQNLEWLADMLVLGLILYMIAELFWAGRAQQREVRLRKAATAANEAKSAFLANVSHEIRTPLNGVLGMAQELSESPLTQDQHELVQVIIGAGELLVSTIDDVLDISKIEADRLEMEHVPLNLEQRLRHNLDLHLRQAREKGVGLSLEIGPEVPAFVVGDPMRLGQVLNNLVSNALKFTQSGAVSVSVSAENAGADDGQVILSLCVRDTGMGIPPEALERIFDPFTQADAGTARQAGGTGLGLTICRRICRQMGGELTVESKVGKGSAFTACFRLAVASAAQREALIEAIEIPGPSQKTPGMVQATLQMPATQIKGADADVQIDLADTVEVAAQVEAPVLLLVDDSRTNRMVMQRFLKGQAREIVEAENGNEAVEAALSRKFDIILMDIQMPGMDGVEATRRIRAYEQEQDLPQTPIIAVTANVMVHQVQEYHDNGMNKVIAKPVKKAQILEILKEYDARRAA